MTTYGLTIRYNTSRCPNDRKAYKTQVFESKEAQRPLKQLGPCCGNIVTYTGVFATRKAAQQAAREYRGF